jgi:LysR family transcriptional regulator for bpeEF and oprC
MSDVPNRVAGASRESADICFAASPGRVWQRGARCVSQLRISAPIVIVQRLLAPALPRFLAQNPDISVRLLNRESDGNASDAVEAAICIGATDTMPGIRKVHLASLRDITCASHEFIAEYGEPRSPAELNPAHCIGIVDDRNKPATWLFRKGSTQISLAPAASLAFNDPQSAAGAAIRGGGFVHVLALAVAGLLKPVLEEWSEPDRRLFMTYRGVSTDPLERFASFVDGLFPSQSLHKASTCGEKSFRKYLSEVGDKALTAIDQ